MPTDAGTGSTPDQISPVPRIIPRQNHQISRKNIDREALKVLYRLRDAGHIAYLVGGGVRDLYLGKTPKDFDISTDAKPGELRRIFKNSRLIGKRFRLVQVFFHGGKIIEVSTFRCRSEYDLGSESGNVMDEVLAANNTYGTPADDAFRRDLTINSLFYAIEDHSIIDYTGGVIDLELGIIRFIGEPERRVQRDPARMMRVIRHAARNNFTIDPQTWEAILKHKEKLKLCPVSRIRDELMKDLRSGAAAAWTELALDSGLFSVLLPFYEKIEGKDANGTTRDLLLGLQTVVDRLHARNMKLPEQLLFSLLILPWTIAEYDILERTYKGAEFHHFLRKIRSRLDEIFSPLGIKRSTKESMALQLVTLPQFIRYAKENNWPKWLKRKSYYRECDLFFRIYLEATGGSRIPEHIIANSTRQFAIEAKRPAWKRKNKNRGGPGPAFVQNKSGSVFGLKKAKQSRG